MAYSDIFGGMKILLPMDDRLGRMSGLEIHPSGKNEALMVVGMAESSKSPPIYIEKREKQHGNKLGVFQELKGVPTSKLFSSTPPPHIKCID